MCDITEILNAVKDKIDSALFYTPLKSGDEISYYFSNPVETVTCFKLTEVNDALERVDSLISKYKYGYGYIAYEAGYSFEERLKTLYNNSESELISFKFFNDDDVKKIPTKNILFKKIESLIKNNNFKIEDLKLNQQKHEYIKSIEEIKHLISIGDTYQVNYTLKSKFNFKGDVSSLVATLLFNQSAEYSAFINQSENYIISTSPELFFKTIGDVVLSKPMKGTKRRGVNLGKDKTQSEELLRSKKDRAENIMIVDLLRNDIGKISKFNSVEANNFFKIEKYESLFQMTSEVTGVLKQKSFKNIIENIFPCGSITGVPKIRTIEIINKLEKEERGIYTGTIGISDSGNLNYNVPIRTITINKNSLKGEMGIGSGVVWDSNPIKEFEETKLKSHFLTKSLKYFELLETMLIENGKVFLFDLHINRLRDAANYFLFRFDENKIKQIVNRVISSLSKNKKYKIRLLLTKWGEVKYSLEQLHLNLPSKKIIVSKKRVESNNKFLYFKTTNREFFDSEFKKWHDKGFDDVIFLNEKNEITQGAISNISIVQNGKEYTPPLSSGLLDGCYRKHLLMTNNNITEKILFVDDLQNADLIKIFNSVRGETNITNIEFE